MLKIVFPLLMICVTIYAIMLVVRILFSQNTAGFSSETHVHKKLDLPIMVFRLLCLALVIINVIFLF